MILDPGPFVAAWRAWSVLVASEPKTIELNEPVSNSQPSEQVSPGPTTTVSSLLPGRLGQPRQASDLAIRDLPLSLLVQRGWALLLGHRWERLVDHRWDRRTGYTRELCLGHGRRLVSWLEGGVVVNAGSDTREEGGVDRSDREVRHDHEGEPPENAVEDPAVGSG